MSDRLVSIDTAKTLLDQLPADVAAAIIAKWDAERDAAMMHKAGAETITGAKTFNAKTVLYGLEVNPLSPANDALVKHIATKSWASGAMGTGDYNVINQTDGRTPLVIAAAAVDQALQILAAVIKVGVDLDLQGHNLQNVGNVNVANGLLQLDGNGKVPAAQLTVDLMQWKGTWNAATNTPTLADGVGSPGDVYKVSVGGTRNLGSGNITFTAGDWVIMNSSNVWELSDQTDAVTSVAGLQGVITAAALRTAMSLVVGTDVQAQNANLQALSGLVGAADTLGYFTGAGAMATTSLTAVGRSIIGAATAAAARTALGLGPAALLNGNVSVPVWVEIPAGNGLRAVGYMDNGLGFMVPANFVLGTAIYRGITADGSGSTTAEIRINGTTAGQKVIPAASQWAMSSSTTGIVGQTVNAGDIIRPYLSGVGGTPGNGFSVTLVGSVSVAVT